MSRHRDIRNMDYSEGNIKYTFRSHSRHRILVCFFFCKILDYDGYDDVYGHSVDDDYYISPSNRQFLYNRENSRGENIQEEDEREAEMTDIEKAKLESCIDQINEMLGSTTIPRNELVNVIVKFNYNTERCLDALLEQQNKEPERKEKGDYIYLSLYCTQSA